MKHLPRWFTILVIAFMLTVPAAVYATEEAPAETTTAVTEEDATNASTFILLIGAFAIAVVGIVWISQDASSRQQENSTTT